MTLRNFSSSAAATTLSAGVSDANTSITVGSTTGFPAAPFILALDAGASAQELVLVTNVAGTTLTVTRGYDSTVATTHDAGAAIQHSHGAIDFREANTHVNAESGVHGATGDVVGTSDAQTLTNKTLTAPAATGSLAAFGGARATWAPGFTNAGAAIAHTVIYARFIQIGKMVLWGCQVNISAAGAGPLRFTLPVAAREANTLVGHGAEINTAPSMRTARTNTLTTAEVRRYDNAAGLANGDVIILEGSYEAA